MVNSTSSSSSLSQRLHEQLREIITEAPAGERLPSEPELANRLGVSRATLREAMRTFETQGLIYRRQGVGTFVVHPSHIIESGLEVLESIESLAERIGLPVKMGVYNVTHRAAHVEEIEALQIDEGSQVVCISRVIEAENRPVAYLVDILPDDLISQKELDREFTGSVLDLLLRRGDPQLGTSRTELRVIPADQEIARSLGVQRKDGVLAFEALLFTVEGRPVDYSFSYFLPGYFRFHVIRRVES